MVAPASRLDLRRAAAGGTIASSPVIAVTSGEPAGIGPEICLRLKDANLPARIVVIGDRSLLPGVPEVAHLPLARPRQAGHLDAANSRYVLALIDRALGGCVAGEFDAMVTAPVQKSVINEAGIAFTGHTEYLAERTATPRVVMLLVGAGLRVALATTHLALADVPRAITREMLAATLRILETDLKRRFKIARPRILVAGLNPHAGEAGYLGREEIEVITPVAEELSRGGMAVSGPYPADTLFTPRMLETADAVLAMYHDQGLPVLKHAAFGEAVNVTLGLPIVRTSVDHGTALDRAGRGEIDRGSLAAAIALACEMASA